MSLKCKPCGREWNQDLPTGPVSQVVKEMSRITCPSCGADWSNLTIGFGGSHNGQAGGRGRALDLGGDDASR